jgi:hypothetical protein
MFSARSSGRYSPKDYLVILFLVEEGPEQFLTQC